MRIEECDKDAMYLVLQNVGINMKDIVGSSRTTDELVELYRYLLRMQLRAWKAGKSHREVVREANEALRKERKTVWASKGRK